MGARETSLGKLEKEGLGKIITSLEMTYITAVLL